MEARSLQALEIDTNKNYKDIVRCFSEISRGLQEAIEKIKIMAGNLERLALVADGCLRNPGFDYRLARSIRKRDGISQKELARLLGISKTSIRRYESGDTIPNPDKYESAKKYLDFLIDNGYRN